jgi:hypothetical protein
LSVLKWPWGDAGLCSLSIFQARRSWSSLLCDAATDRCCGATDNITCRLIHGQSDPRPLLPVPPHGDCLKGCPIPPALGTSVHCLGTAVQSSSTSPRPWHFWRELHSLARTDTYGPMILYPYKNSNDLIFTREEGQCGTGVERSGDIR